MKAPAAQRIVRARTNLLLAHFFWGRLALRLKMTEDRGIPTLAVDGDCIFYNPDFIDTLSDDLLKSAIVHEVGHCMLDHIFRRGARDPKMWNVACDYAINLMLKDARFVIGKDWLLDEQYRDMTADAIYERLQKDGSGGKNGAGQQPLCDVKDGAQSATEAAAKSLEWKSHVAQAAMEAEREGNLPASLRRFVDTIVRPQVPWRELLQRWASELARDDYSWSRPNRRFVAQGIYLPALRNETIGPLVAAVDVSGSITQTCLDAFGAEVRQMVAACRPTKLTVIYCDAEVNHVDEFLPGEEIRFELHGGGGTDFRPPFKYLEDKGEVPVAFVYLTDMYGPFPKGADFPVLWCSTTPDRTAPFGETVYMDV